MKKIIPLSLMALSVLAAQETELQSIKVESTYITEVAKKAQKSADLADALSTQVPSIDMNRRSGIANDIIIRGQKRDNISIEVDGTKVCGACPNRMDPPVSHVLASQIEDIEVTEGPYDVETFGVMSGGVKVTTKKPSKDFKGEINLGAGSFGYKKAGATVSGGNDIVRALVSASYENSAQYEDGDGNTLAEQVKNYAASIDPTDPNYSKIQGQQYATEYEDMDAYTKQSVMTKLFINPLEDHELRLSYTANRSDDVLYANSGMDAILDDSDIYNIEYEVSNISNMYKDVKIQYYKSEVDHPMGTDYRQSAAMMIMTNHMNSEMEGLKLINTLEVADMDMDIGLDSSERLWNGFYYMNNNPMMSPGASIDNAVTKNTAVFAKLKKSLGDLDVKVGLRYDTTDITVDDTDFQDNDYTGFNANIVTNYNLSEKSKMFVGFGQANRVPDARELYFTKYNTATSPATKMLIGTDTLEQTTNRQLDFGYERKSNSYNVKVKAFYSMLSDYIYYHKGAMMHAFENIDATIYGGEFNTNYFPMDELELSLSVSYKKGEKDEALSGQTDTDLADIAPLRSKLSASYEYMANSVATLEFHRSEKWSDYDADNGEQELDAWNILNLKVEHTFSKMIDLTVGVNNILDETYAMSNTYSDITLVTAGADDVMLLNEPGRYLYTNLNLKF